MEFPPLPKGSRVTNLTKKDVVYLDERILEPSGRLRLLPASEYNKIEPMHLVAWANLNGRYCLPTVELVAWLRGRIAGRRAIEIGAGYGDLGSRLVIPMTDSYQQITDPTTVAYYTLLGMAPTKPQPDVEMIDAETAVRSKRPEVVVAAWVTQKHLPGNTKGNMYGPREEYILDHCQEYILIGNTEVHGDKRIMSRPHESYQFPWLIPRAFNPLNNAIWVWKP